MSFAMSYRPFRLVLSSFMLATCGCGCDRHDKAEKPMPAATASESSVTKAKPREPLIKKQEIEDWCPEHGVPESICTRCNSSLIAGFKEKGDWCKEHDLPDSQCFVCHPELKQKFEAMKPKGG